MAANIVAVNAAVRHDARRSKSFRKSKRSKKKAKKEALYYGLLPFQKNLFTFYNSNRIQITIAILIFTNFFISTAEAEIVPAKGSHAYYIFSVLERIFGFIFLIELIINMYAHWFFRFWKDLWNWFDLLIVIVSLISISVGDLPAVNVLRLFRAFRVFRLFKRVPTLKSVINGVFASLPGIANAFVVMSILMGIWAIIGVELYADIKDEEFGTFAKAIFTLWQVMSMDSWASGIARGIIFKHTEIDNVVHVEMVHPEAMPYFVTYLLAVGIIMMNVVVAILLEFYMEAAAEVADEEYDDSDEESMEEKKLLDRVKDVDKQGLMDLVNEVVSTNVVYSFNRKNLDEIFNVLMCNVNGRQEIKEGLNRFKIQAEFENQF